MDNCKVYFFNAEKISILLALYRIPIFLESLHSMSAIWSLQFKCSLIKTPRNFKQRSREIAFELILRSGISCGNLVFRKGLWKNIYFVFWTFKDNLLLWNQSLILSSSLLTVSNRAWIFLLDLNRLVSSAKIIDSSEDALCKSLMKMRKRF